MGTKPLLVHPQITKDLLAVIRIAPLPQTAVPRPGRPVHAGAGVAHRRARGAAAGRPRHQRQRDARGHVLAPHDRPAPAGGGAGVHVLEDDVRRGPRRSRRGRHGGPQVHVDRPRGHGTGCLLLPGHGGPHGRLRSPRRRVLAQDGRARPRGHRQVGHVLADGPRDRHVLVGRARPRACVSVCVCVCDYVCVFISVCIYLCVCKCLSTCVSDFRSASVPACRRDELPPCESTDHHPGGLVCAAWRRQRPRTT